MIAKIQNNYETTKLKTKKLDNENCRPYIWPAILLEHLKYKI